MHTSAICMGNELLRDGFFAEISAAKPIGLRAKSLVITEPEQIHFRTQGSGCHNPLHPLCTVSHNHNHIRDSCMRQDLKKSIIMISMMK